MTTGFTRQEVIAMTSISSGRLSYLDQKGVVIPQKFGNKHPVVIYSWQQVLQIKIIDKLREKLSLQEVRKIVNFLQDKEYKRSLFDCNLVFIGKCLYLIEDWQEFGTKVLEESRKNKGQVAVHKICTLAELIAELQREADVKRVLDFDKRTKGTLLEKV